jgi:hypothetical protein
MRRILLLLAAGAAIGLAGTLANRGEASAGRCSGAHTRTLVESRNVRVYASPSPSAIRRKFDVYACAKATGKQIGLDDPEEGDYAFLPPSIGLKGSVVGSALQSYCGAQGSCLTGVVAYDLRFAGTQRDRLNGGFAGPPHHRLVKVGSLRVTTSGTLIWITCPERAREGLIGSQRPNCVRAGDADNVYMLQPQGSMRRLDHGRTIDPSSLSLHGRRATWKHGSTRRHATLP